MRVYVAGPLSHGDETRNVERAQMAGLELLDAGHEPFVPHLNHYWAAHESAAGVSYEEWLRIDFAWLSVAEALVRLPGYSPGACREEAFARELGIPVYEGVGAFLAAVGVGAP